MESQISYQKTEISELKLNEELTKKSKTLHNKMAKEIEAKTAEETAEVKTEEVAIVPDLNAELVKSISELKTEVADVKKVISENKVDLSKEKSASTAIPEKKEDVGLKVKNWIDNNMNKGWNAKGLIEGNPATGSTVAVPQELQDEILRQANETGIVRKFGQKIRMNSQTLAITVTDGEPEAIWGGQTLASDTTGCTYTEVKFTRQPLEVKTVVSNPLIEDKVNMLPHLSEVGATAIRKAEDRVAFSKLATSAGNEVKLTGTLTQGALTLQKMRDLYNAGTYPRTNREMFFMHRNTWALVQGLSDDTTIVDFTNQMFFGVPVGIVNSMTDYIASDGTNKTYVICTDPKQSLGLGVRNDEQVGVKTSDQAVVGGVSMWDTNQTAVKYIVDEDIQILRPKYVSKLTSAH